jgi:ribonuclease BN (tRNA processing enzyme)
MRVKLLGAHQGETRDARFMSLLVDDRLAIDAGGLTHALTRDEQLAIEAVLITHRHYDHIKDLPGLAHTLWKDKDLQLYCTPDTRDALRAHIFNGKLWPSLEEASDGYYATLFNDVEPERAFSLLGYDILPITMSHTVPTVGYLLEKEGKRVFYTADTRYEEHPRWVEHRLDLLIVETTMSGAFEEDASRFGHMTPLSLERVLRIFQAKQGYFPRTVCVHINPEFEDDIRQEVAALAARLDADISAGSEGMALDL